MRLCAPGPSAGFYPEHGAVLESFQSRVRSSLAVVWQTAAVIKAWLVVPGLLLVAMPSITSSKEVFNTHKLDGPWGGPGSR